MPEKENSNNSFKFIIPGIIVALFAYQAMKSQPQPQQAQPPQTPSQGNPQTPSQGGSQPPDRENPQSSGRSTLVGIWQAVGSTGDGRFVAKINFQPNGTFLQEMTFAGGDNPYSSGISTTYGSYKQNAQNSVVILPEKTCVEGLCTQYTRSSEFTIVSATELSSDGTKFRKISN